METPPVLIVEDDESIRELYTAAFKAAQITVITAADGQAGLALALEHHPSVILIDIMMPKQTGLETIEKLRLDSWGKTAKVVYLTNMSDPTNVSGAVKNGSDDYIVKSNTEPKEVVNRVRTIMHQ
ncbi:response regulator [Candidatus Pacebacteria bacterium]|nr:response regulator [Candidatus Paceibacterota bacterium]